MALPIRTRPSFPHSQSLPSGSFHKPLILLDQRADRLKTTITETNQTDHMDHSQSNSMKLWAMTNRATHDGQVMVERSDRMWSTGERNGKLLQYSCLEDLMNSMKRQKDRTLKDELPRSVGAQYATGEEWRNNSRRSEDTEPKWKHCPVTDVISDGSRAQCCKEQYCIGTWNVRSMCICTSFTQVTLCDPMDSSLPGLLCRNSPGKNSGEDCHSLSPEELPNPGSNPGLLPHRQILYHLSYSEV